MSDHFDGDKFFNSIDHKDKSLSDLLKWQINRKPVSWPKSVENEGIADLTKQLKVGQYSVTFINHSTFLIQIQTQEKLVNILTDPIFSERSSPFSFLGPRRVRKPGLSFEELPHIDLVLISHNHYDHMDYDSLKNLNEKFSPLFIMPLGNAAYLDFSKKPKVEERDWGEFVDLPNWSIKIHVTRAHHWSRRSLFDTNKALWSAFVIEALGKMIYFAGDTGYQSHFKETKKRFSKIDLALLPIGAYEPRWFMQDAHMNPDDAIKAHQDLGAELSLGIHFGTFQLTDEGIDQPVLDLEKAKKKNNVSNFEILKFGETRWFLDDPKP